jgi:hypothetical protein
MALLPLLPLTVHLLLAVAATAIAPTPSPPPPPPPIACLGGEEPCLPAWKPTWHMKNSTVLYACNVSGMHSVHHANQFGIVVYDWSNARAIWTNAHPMSSEELLLKQAEMVLAANPGVPGYAPRVWVYRNTIKALNWFSSVREKLDDPRYASWFVKFKGFSDKPYPGGAIAQPQNGSYNVPACDWYDNGTAPRCSGFYHVRVCTRCRPFVCWWTQIVMNSFSMYAARARLPRALVGPTTDSRAPKSGTRKSLSNGWTLL